MWKRSVQEVLSSATWLVGHSLPGDVDQLLMNGFELNSSWLTGERCLDSLLLARMSDENRLSYGLENLACTLLGAAPWKSDSNAAMAGGGGMLSVLPSVRKERCRLDAYWARRLAEHFLPALKSNRPLLHFTHRVAWTIHRLCLAGAVVDLDEFARMSDGVRLNTAAVESRLRGEGNTDESFSPTNDHHVRALLYDQLGLEPPGYSKKSRLPSVTKGALASLDHPTARLLVEFSHWEKLRSTYVVGLSGLIVPAGEGRGWRRGHINPWGARTGRRSSEDPNSQNWPDSVRRIVRSRWPGGSIGDFDYSRLEPVILGWIIGDERFLRAFTTGRGYVDIARWLFNRSGIEEGTKEYGAAKAIVLSTNYDPMNTGVWKVARKLGVSEREATELRRKYFRGFPAIRKYMDTCREELLRTGQVVSASGRVRRLSVPDGENTPGFGHLFNEAVNFKIQSFASDVTGSALVDVEAALLREHNQTLTDHHRKLVEIEKSLTNGHGLGTVESVGSLIENEVHDSLVADLHPASAARDAEVIREVMRAVPTLRRLVPSFDAPLNVKVKIGERWGGE